MTGEGRAAVLEWAAQQVETLALAAARDPTRLAQVRLPYAGGLADAARWLHRQADAAGEPGASEPEAVFELALDQAVWAYGELAGLGERQRATLRGNEQMLAVVRAVVCSVLAGCSP